MFHKIVKKSGMLEILEESDRILLDNMNPKQKKDLVIQGFYHPKAYRAAVYTLFNLHDNQADECIDIQRPSTVAAEHFPAKLRRG